MIKVIIDIWLLLVSLGYIIYMSVGWKKRTVPEDYCKLTKADRRPIKIFNQQKVLHNLALVLSFGAIDFIRYYFFDHSLSLFIYNTGAYIYDIASKLWI